MLEPFLAENVAKEARKDALVIRRAGAAEAAGTPPGPQAAREILGEARAIDREFLGHVAMAPLRLAIRYERIEPLRLRRIDLALDAAFRILDAWRHRRRLRDAFAPEEFERRIADILRLYAEETQALSRSVELPRLLAPLRDHVTQRVGEAMRRAALQLARAAARMGRHGAPPQFRQ